jgi:arginine/ornithine N-succinyltransferase beta subunit
VREVVVSREGRRDEQAKPARRILTDLEEGFRDTGYIWVFSGG